MPAEAERRLAAILSADVVGYPRRERLRDRLIRSIQNLLP